MPSLQATVRCIYGRRAKRRSFLRDVVGLRQSIPPLLSGSREPISMDGYCRGVRGGNDHLIDIGVMHVYRPTAARIQVVDGALWRARQIWEENGFSIGRVDHLIPKKSFIDDYREVTSMIESLNLLWWDHPRDRSMDIFFIERLKGASGRATVEGAIVEIDNTTGEFAGRVLAHEMGHALGLIHREDVEAAGFVPFQRSLMAQSSRVRDPQRATRLGSTEKSTVRLSPFVRRGC